MQVQFQLTVDDLLEANQFDSARGFQKYRTVAYSAGALLILFLVGLQILYYQMVLNFVFAGAALWMWVYSRVMQRSRRRGVQKAWERSPNQRHPLRYEFSEQGISAKSQTGRGETTWKDVSASFETPRLFLLYTGKHQFFVVPKRSFEAPGQLEAFRGLLRDRIPLASH